VAYVRTVKTASGATAVQIVWSSTRGARKIEHLGSAHDEQQLAALRASGEEKIAAGQTALDLGIGEAPPAGPLPITASRMAVLWDTLDSAYRRLGFDTATGSDAVFRDLVLARIIEPTSKLDSLRVLEEVGQVPPSYRTITRRLPVYAKSAWRQVLSAACADHAGIGPATLLLYDVTTLYFETDTEDEFRKPGFSKERRLEPQITVGLLTDPAGFPLQIEAFEGNRAETTTMLPTIEAFTAAHQLEAGQVTIVADAGMVSAANKQALEAVGLRFIIGERLGASVPWIIADRHKRHPGQEPDDQMVLTQPIPAGPSDRRRDHVVYYQYRAARARRTLKGIDEQIAKAQSAVDGKIPVKRNRFVTIKDAKKSINRDLETRNRTLAGWKAYVTNIDAPTPEFVIGSYHQLWRIEKSFRMTKSDLAARPIYHRLRERIDAHLTIVFAALAITRLIEGRTGWSIKKFITTARRYRTIEIQAGPQAITAADPVPAELQDAITALLAHQIVLSQAPSTITRIIREVATSVQVRQ